MRHRVLRETMSLAQLDRTRALLYSALLPLPAAPRDTSMETRRQRLSLFLILPTASAHPPPFRLCVLDPVPRTASFAFFPMPRNKPRDYWRTWAFRRKREEKKKRNGRVQVRKVAAVIRGHSRRFNELVGRARRGARNPFGRESACALGEADNCSLPFARSERRKGQRPREMVMQNGDIKLVLLLLRSRDI